MKMKLEMFLNEVRKATLGTVQSIRPNQPVTPPKCLHLARNATSSNPINQISEKIFAMRKEEDSAVLITWLKQILPSLSKILARSIGLTYSASLVRQGLSSASAQAVIRIQSPIKPSREVQSYVQRQVIALCDRSLVAGSIRLQFSEGDIKLLAGSFHQSDSDASLMQVDVDEEDNSCRFPHWKRFWPRPGMSASIGMLCTRKVSATACCYVDMDGEKLLLTVNHFIKDSQSKNDNGVEDKLSLTSPALLEIDEMTRYFDQFLRNVDIEIEVALRNQYGDTLPSILEYSDEIRDLGDKKEYAQKLAEELSRRKDENHIVLASVVHRNKSDSRIPIGKTAALWSELGYTDTNVRHRMDWALFNVSERRGINRIRYRIDPNEGTVDFFSGDIEKWGASESCQKTCNVEANAKVYYVGQTSGLQLAEINAAPVQVSRNGIVTLEWALTVSEEEQKDNKKYAGDSGAGIMRISDNSLVGQLWGYQDNQLLFTPINDVFADIKEQTGAANVDLPPTRTNPMRPPILNSSLAEREPTLICRDLTKESPNRRRAKTSDLQLPVLLKKDSPRRLASAIPTLERSPVNSTHPSLGKLEAIVDPVFTLKNRSSSPVPSLTSSSLPTSKSAIFSEYPSLDEIRRGVISIGPKPRTRSDKPIVVIRNDSEASELPVPKEVPISKIRLQELTERLLGTVADKENRMSFENTLKDKPSLKRMRTNSSPFPRLKRLTEQRRSGARSETWSKTGFRQVRPEILFA